MEGRAMAGVLVLSVDLELEIDHSDRLRDEQLDAVRSRLVGLTQQHRIAATWAVADPLLSAATDQVLHAGAGHELAVLGDRSWIGPGYGRGRIARELDRRLGRARKAGIAVQALALRNVEPSSVLQLLNEHGIMAVRGPAIDAAVAVRKLAAPSVRFGLWQAPPPWQLPLVGRWWLPASWGICYEIRRTSDRESLLHLAIDAPRLVEAGPEGLNVVESVLRYAAARRDAGHLRIATVRELAEEALHQRANSHTRSILRPAA